MTDKRYLTPKEFAVRTRRHINTVRRRLRKGQLPAVQEGGSGTGWLIDYEAYQQSFSQKDGAGEPAEGSLAGQSNPGPEPVAAEEVSATGRRGPKPGWKQRLSLTSG